MPLIELLLSALGVVALVVLSDSLGSWLAFSGKTFYGTLVYLGGFVAAVTLAFGVLPSVSAILALVVSCVISSAVARPLMISVLMKHQASRPTV